MSSFCDALSTDYRSMFLKQTYHLEDDVCSSCNTMLFCHYCFMLRGHRFHHAVIFQGRQWQVFSLQSCTNRFWLICIRITKWDKVKQKNTITVSGNATNTCLMQWIVRNNGLTACTMQLFMLRISFTAESQKAYGVGGSVDLCRLLCKCSFPPDCTGRDYSQPGCSWKLYHHNPALLPK